MKKRNLMRVIILLSLMCFYVDCSTIAGEDESRKVLVDITEKISAGGISYSRFAVVRACTVKVEMKVTSGDGVKLFLLDDENLALLVKGESFKCYVILSCSSPVTSYSKSATLPQGIWNVVIVNPNSFFSQTVSRKITVE